MKNHRILPLLTCTLTLAALPVFANKDRDAGDKIKMLDTDGDGRVSRSEFAAAKQDHFRKLDANNDGVVTPSESSVPATGEKKPHWWNRDDKSTEAEKIFMADANGDGLVTVDEAAAYAEQKFGKLDANADGYVTEAEFEAAHK